MHRHTHFNLCLHDDDELAAHLGAAITERETMHQWPLSCVQSIPPPEAPIRDPIHERLVHPAAGVL